VREKVYSESVTMAVRPKKWESITVPMMMALVFSLYATADDRQLMAFIKCKI
jgi:hypothetical protein